MSDNLYGFRIVDHLHCYEGKCKNLHGHTYKVIFGISGFVNEIGLVLDFAEIKEIWKKDIEIYLDHRYLNETLPHMNTTAGNMVVWMYEKMNGSLEKNNDQELRVEFARLYETPSSYAEVTREWIEE